MVRRLNVPVSVSRDYIYVKMDLFLKMSPASPSLPFAIERDTGQLLTTSTIDREQHSEYKFSVIVTDSRSPVYTSSSTVTVAIDDENDNAPVFSAQQYGVSFPEDRDFTDDRELILV